jgi:hypothetical protein
MFGFFKHKPKQLSDEDYLKEFQRLLHEIEDQFAIGDTSHEQLLHSMGVIEKEMNHNGGCNWQETDYIEYLETIEDFLTAEKSFTLEQQKKIQWSLEEIIECGRELEQKSESSRNATEAVDFLAARVVDWCHIHPSEKSPET